MSGVVWADNRPYLCEIGLQGGLGYYAGEATPHIFQDVSYAGGLHFRYKFTRHLSLKMNGMYQLIQGPYQDYRNPDNAALMNYRNQHKLTDDSHWSSRMINMDITAEYNFFRLGIPKFDGRVKPYSPYVFLGLGCGLFPSPVNEFGKMAVYLPLGIGFKWQFVEWGALHVAWQHNIYFSDDLENVWNGSKNILGNTCNLNGSNIMNMDITSQLTVGIVFAFAKERKICKLCEEQNEK